MATDSLTANKMHRTRNNMDAVRYVLSLAVIVTHINVLWGYDIPFPVSGHTAVSGFFALSGFLIFRSYEKSPRLGLFLERRARRILPPYFLIVVLCAVGLFFVSSADFQGYFLSAGWWKYLVSNLAFCNFLEPSLPGVFDGPAYVHPAVNGSLWTMKVEWCLYLSVPVVAWLLLKLKARFRARNAVFLTVILVSIAYRLAFMLLFDATGREIFDILGRQFFGQLAFFYVGVVVYYNFDAFMRRRWLLLVLLLAGLLAEGRSPYADCVLEPFVQGSLILWFSFVGQWGKYFSRHDNVSYDMYLFHWPILQLGVYFGLPGWGTWPAVAVAVAAIVAFSFLSWNFIGKRFMYRPAASSQSILRSVGG